MLDIMDSINKHRASNINLGDDMFKRRTTKKPSANRSRKGTPRGTTRAGNSPRGSQRGSQRGSPSPRGQDTERVIKQESFFGDPSPVTIVCDDKQDEK